MAQIYVQFFGKSHCQEIGECFTKHHTFQSICICKGQNHFRRGQNHRVFGFGPSFIQWIHTFYKNVSSCVLNNGFATSSFSFERGVREGDPLSAYLFIIALEVLCVNIRNSNDIRGIKVDKEEIKLSLFVDDLTGFLNDDLSLKLIEDYGTCSGPRLTTKRQSFCYQVTWPVPYKKSL